MAHIAYLSLKGAKQGLISSGCNTKDSMGNRYQETHTDQITVLACHYSLSKRPHQHSISHDGIVTGLYASKTQLEVIYKVSDPQC